MSLSRWWRARRRRRLQLWVVGLLASLFVTSIASLDDVVSVQRVLDILMYLRQPMSRSTRRQRPYRAPRINPS